MAKLILENMEFYAFHGHFAEEQVIGGKYRVDLILETDISKAVESDELEDAIDYPLIYKVIKQEMNKPAKLVEHLAGRIADAVYANFKGIDKLTVRVSKLNPPAGGQIGNFAVEITQ